MGVVSITLRMKPALFQFGTVGWNDAGAVGAADHERVAALVGEREIRLPLAETVFPGVRAELHRLPGFAAIRRDIDLGDPGIAAKRNPADQGWRSGPHLCAGRELG